MNRLLTLFLIIFLSCSADPVMTSYGELSDCEEQGVLVQLPETERGFDLEGAVKKSNLYEVIVYNRDTLFSQTAQPGEAVFLRIPPGDYRVVVLAGYRKSDTSAYCSLLGSGSSEMIAVHSGSFTEVPLSLNPFLMDTHYELAIAAGSEWSFFLTGSTGCIQVIPDTFDLTFDGEITSQIPVITGSDFEITSVFSAPASQASSELKLYNTGTTARNGLILVDDELEQKRPLVPEEGFQMEWCFYKTGSKSDVWYNDLNKTINYLSDEQTGMEVKVQWSL